MRGFGLILFVLALLSCHPQPITPANLPGWVSINQGLATHAPVLSIAIDPSGTIYAATYDRIGLYRSIGGPGHWTPDDHGLAGVPTFTLLTTRADIWTGTAAGLYRRGFTVDKWEREAAVPAVAVYSLAQSRESHLYAATDSDGIFASADGGETWTRLPGLQGESVLSVLATDPETILAGTSGHGVFLTRDEGKTWTPISAFENAYIPWIATDPQNARILFAGTRRAVMRSIDGGVSWGVVQGGIEGEQVYSLLVSAEGKTMLAGTASHGIFTSQDQGETWMGIGEIRSTGALTVAPVPEGHAVLSLAASGNLVLAGTTDGVIYSLDGGRSWSPADYHQLEGIGTPRVHDLALDPANGTVLAATEDGLYLRSEGDWRLYGGGTVDLPVLALASAPSDPRSIYAGTSHRGVYVSGDGGISWKGAGGDLGGRASVAGIVVDPRDERNVFARVLYERIYKSTDGGDNWHTVWTGMPTDTEIETIAIDPNDPTKIFAGGDKQVFFSSDSGETWTGGALAGISTLSLLIDPSNSQRVLAGTTDGLYTTLDGGRNWAQSGLGRITVSVLVRGADGSIYVGTKNNGLFVSRDDARSVQSLGTGLEQAGVVAVVVDDAHRTLYAATNSGIFCLSLGDRAGVQEPSCS